MLDVQAADRSRFRVDYQNFVNKLPKNTYTKFSTKLVTETSSVLVSPDSPRLNRSQKLLNFEGAELWETFGEEKTCTQIIDHFKLKSIAIVNPSSNNGGSLVLDYSSSNSQI